jgi:hypothetical protein
MCAKTKRVMGGKRRCMHSLSILNGYRVKVGIKILIGYLVGCLAADIKAPLVQSRAFSQSATLNSIYNIVKREEVAVVHSEFTMLATPYMLNLGLNLG